MATRDTARTRTARPGGLSRESELLGGGRQNAAARATEVEAEVIEEAERPGTGPSADALRPPRPVYDANDDPLSLPHPSADLHKAGPELRELKELIPTSEPSRQVDDWGRSDRIFDAMQPLLDFYYRYWFRVEVEGIENVPSDGGALLTSNHSGALPPDAPMIMQAILHEHPNPRPVYVMAEHWFKGYPGIGLLTNKLGVVAAHPANAQRLLADENGLALVFPEGQKATRKLYWQRYKLRRFGRGGFVRTAMRAGVPIVPIAVVGAEDAMPIFAHVPLLQKLTGLIYFPINHAFPQFGLAAGLMYMPAKFKIRFMEPVDLSEYGPEGAEDLELVRRVSEEIRARIQHEVDDLLESRASVWFG